MNQPEQFERRARVGGGSRQDRLVGAVAGLGALLLLAMVLAARVDAPPPPAAPTEMAVLTPPGETVAAPRLYLVGRHIENDAANGWRETERLAVVDSATRQLAYSLDDARDAALSGDGRRLYALTTERLTVLEADTKQTLWSLDLAPFAPANTMWQTLLALAPDERTVLIYRQEIVGNTARAWIEQVDLGTRQQAAIIAIAEPQWVNSLLIAADGQTVFLSGFEGVSVLDLRGGGQKQLLSTRSLGPHTSLYSALSADRRRLYVVESAGWIVEYDPLSQREIRRIRLQDPALTPVESRPTLAIAPANDRLALLVNQRGAPTISAGQRVENVVGQALVVVSLDDGSIIRRNDRANQPQALAWSSDGAQIYFVEYGQIYRWDQRTDRVFNEQWLGNDDTITRMLLGPALPLQVPPATPTPPGGPPPPPTLTPVATPTPLLQTDQSPFAWLWPLNGAQQSVVEFSRDGSTRTVADKVIYVIARPQQPPLLLQAPEPNQWALFDPATGIGTTLDLALPPSGFPGAMTFLLSPDGARLAFVTSHDPKPADELAAHRQLVTVDIATGAVDVLIDAGRWDQIYYGELLEWATDGIYLSSTLEKLSAGDAPRAIWRIDPDVGEPELLLAVEDRGANFQLNAAAGLLLYEPYPEDINNSSLRLRNLRSGTEQILLDRTPFINRDEMQIAPDGRFVAFLRPGRKENEVVLSLYNVQTRVFQHLYSGRYQSWPYALHWSNAGRQLHLRTYEQALPHGVEQELVWDLSDAGSSLEEPTHWTVPSAGFMPPPVHHGVELVSAKRSLALASFGDHFLLQEHSDQPSPQLVVSIPLPSPRAQNNDPLQLRRDTRIVYVP